MFMIYGWIALLIILWALIVYTKSTHYKGWILEWKISRAFEQIARKFGGMQFQNIMIPFNGGTQQIDNVLLTSKAIYVIEAKNYSGFIFGSLNNEKWTMTSKTVKTYRNRGGYKYKKSFINKNTFYNPIKQNQTHVKAITTLLKSPSIPVLNIVVFGQKANLKEINTDDLHPVIHFNELKSRVKKYEHHHSDKVTHEALAGFVDDLFFYNIKDRKLRKAHIKEIKQKYYIKKG